jgi:hypothetical protein
VVTFHESNQLTQPLWAGSGPRTVSNHDQPIPLHVSEHTPYDTLGHAEHPCQAISPDLSFGRQQPENEQFLLGQHAFQP